VYRPVPSSSSTLPYFSLIATSPPPRPPFLHDALCAACEPHFNRRQFGSLPPSTCLHHRLSHCPYRSPSIPLVGQVQETSPGEDRLPCP
jgi:hypothetical protein